jgi:polysaccharide export outer membrane protein
MRKKLKWYIPLFFLLAVLFSGCRVFYPSQMFKTGNDFAYNNFDTTGVKEYVIRPFDKLQVRVYTNGGYILVDMEGKMPANINIPEYRVDKEGKIKLPIIGNVRIAGMTIEKAEDFLEKEYSKYMKEPFVLINVTNRRVFVFSAGAEKGDVVYMDNDNFTLIEALAKVGGISSFSKAYRIKLIRGDLNNPQVYVFNVRSLKNMKKSNFVLQSNDIIYVEARPKYASRLLGEISPYISLLTSILFLYGLFYR